MNTITATAQKEIWTVRTASGQIRYYHLGRTYRARPMAKSLAEQMLMEGTAKLVNGNPLHG